MNSIPRSLTFLLAVFWAVGCVREPETRRFADPKVVRRDVPDHQTLDERYSGAGTARGRNPHGEDGAGAGASDGSAEGQRVLGWDTPDGWRERPLSRYRLGSFEIPDGGDCSISRIGGGLVQNINRWRKQFGLPATNQREIRALPQRPVSNSEGYLIEFTGDYTGMRGEQIQGAKLLGLVAPIDESVSLFLKFTGPAAVVDANREQFFSLSASLRPARNPAAPGGGNLAAGDRAGTGDGFDPRELTWTVPSSWEAKTSSSSRRVVTVGPADLPDIQAWIIPLPGSAGGLQPNINRWRGEVQQAPLSDAEVAALPSLDVLGVPCPLVEVYGNYKGQNGEQRDGGLLGVLCSIGSYTVFVKMVGPADSIRAEKARFVEFVTSLSVP